MMLASMRNAAQTWVAKILLALVVLSFAGWGINDIFRGFQTRDLATVGDRTISGPEFQQSLTRTIQQLGQQSGTAFTVEDARKLGIDRQVLDRMIAAAALDAQADRLGVLLSDQAIAAQVMSNPAFKNADGNFDPARFRTVLQQNGITEQAYAAIEKRDQLRQQLAAVASNQPPFPKTLFDAMLQYRDEKRSARYFSFTVNEADVPAPSADEIKKQYESSPAAYTAPEYRSLEVIKVEPSDIAAKTQVTDDEIKAGYEAKKAEYFSPEKRTFIQLSFPDEKAATDAKARIDKGEDILKVAEGLGMKETDIRFTDRTRDQFLDKAIGDAVFKQPQDAVSAPVPGDLTTAIIKVLAITPEHQATLDEVKDKVKQSLQLEKARDEIQSVYDSVEDARAQEMKFEDIAARAGIPSFTIPAVSQTGLDKAGKDVALPFKDELLKAAFASDVGVENDALTIGDAYVWYEVREVIPSAVRPLDEVKDQVTADWKATKLRTLASDKAKDIVAKAGTNTSLETLSQQAGATIQKVDGVLRNQTSAQFDGAATAALFAAPEKSLTWSLEGDGRSARIIEVSKVDVPTLDQTTGAAKELKTKMTEGVSNDLAETYLLAVRNETKVTINNDLWASIRGSNTQ